jgi:hypothetical protein
MMCPRQQILWYIALASIGKRFRRQGTISAACAVRRDVSTARHDFCSDRRAVNRLIALNYSQSSGEHVRLNAGETTICVKE